MNRSASQHRASRRTRAVAALCLTLLLAAGSAVCQSLEMRVTPEDIPLDEVAALQVLLRDPPTDAPRIPTITAPGFAIEALPPPGGRFTSEGILWRYLLVPVDTGSVAVEAALTVNGQLLRQTRNVRTFDRAKPSSPAREPAANRSRSDRAASEDLTGRRFVRAEIDRTSAFVHQQVTYRFRYYFENWLPAREAPQYALPTFEGFLAHPLDDSRATQKGKETVDGREYYVEEIRVALFPLTPGERRLPPTRLILPAVARMPSRELTTEPVSLTARPLPAEPPDFSGGVGEFTVRAEFMQFQGRAGEPLTLHTRIEGRGNLATLTRVPRPTADGVTVYEPTVKDTMDVVGDQWGGTRTFEYVLTPTQAGTFTVVVPEIVTFSPSQGSYVRSEPISLTVPVGEALRDDSDGAQPVPIRRGSGWAPWLALLAALVVGWLLWRRRNRRAESVEPRADAASRPTRTTSAGLDGIRVGDGQRVCRELGGLLRARAAQAMGVPAESPDLLSRLGQSGTPNASAVVDLIRRCDEGAFAPIQLSASEQQSLIDAAQSALGAFAPNDPPTS
ncbi:protein BatD [Candidatus Poribacteria bacterium]|nr:protein BatD [Candidatus Poribacteria bacterium]